MDFVRRGASRAMRGQSRQAIAFDYIVWRALTVAALLPKRCRMSQQRISSLTPIAHVLARVDALARPVAPREAALADAEGRVLAEDVVAAAPSPAAPIALIDGWAVRAEAVADAGPYAPVRARRAARVGRCGRSRCRAMPMRCCRPMRSLAPRCTPPRRRAMACSPPARMPRRVTPLRRAGERLRAADVAALQAAGVSRVTIREPRVRVVAMPGCDAVALAISRGVAAQGANVIFVRALERALADEQTDAVITVGGTGAGSATTRASRCWRAWARSRFTASGSRRAKRRRSAPRRGMPC